MRLGKDLFFRLWNCLEPGPKDLRLDFNLILKMRDLTWFQRFLFQHFICVSYCTSLVFKLHSPFSSCWSLLVCLLSHNPLEKTNRRLLTTPQSVGTCSSVCPSKISQHILLTSGQISIKSSLSIGI